MSETEQDAGNSYVATAAAEKRLREVLESEFPSAAVGSIAEILLREAKIEYKPRLKAVLVTLPIPDTAPRTKPTAEQVIVAEEEGPCPRCGGEGCPAWNKQAYDEQQLSQLYDRPPEPTPGFRPFQPKPAPAEGYVDSDV